MCLNLHPFLASTCWKRSKQSSIAACNVRIFNFLTSLMIFSFSCSTVFGTTGSVYAWLLRGRNPHYADLWSMGVLKVSSLLRCISPPYLNQAYLNQAVQQGAMYSYYDLPRPHNGAHNLAAMLISIHLRRFESPTVPVVVGDPVANLGAL